MQMENKQPGMKNQLEKNWKRVDHEPIVPLFTGTPGVQIHPPPNSGVLGYFDLFMTDELYTMIVTETNRYAAQYKKMTQRFA